MTAAAQPPPSPPDRPADRSRRLLVFNCHEAWVHQLGGLPMEMDVLIGLKGRYKETWDEQMRPIPPNARLVTLAQVGATDREYYCIIAHNITDLLEVKHLPGPRLIVIHSTLEGRAEQEQSNVPPEKFGAMLRQYLQMTSGHAVPCSLLKGKSWGITDDIVPFAVDADDYPPHDGQEPAGLRISNHIKDRRKILIWEFHDKAFSGLPIRLVGHNPDMPDVQAADSWDELKGFLQTHRFYIHTADPRYEDGYNMATLEAMAAGLPVLGNCHPTSPIINGVNGFLSDDPDVLRSRAEQLLAEKPLADRMGQEARKTAVERFPLQRFREDFSKSIEIARKKWADRG